MALNFCLNSLLKPMLPDRKERMILRFHDNCLSSQKRESIPWSFAFVRNLPYFPNKIPGNGFAKGNSLGG